MAGSPTPLGCRVGAGRRPGGGCERGGPSRWPWCSSLPHSSEPPSGQFAPRIRGAFGLQRGGLPSRGRGGAQVLASGITPGSQRTFDVADASQFGGQVGLIGSRRRQPARRRCVERCGSSRWPRCSSLPHSSEPPSGQFAPRIRGAFGLQEGGLPSTGRTALKGARRCTSARLRHHPWQPAHPSASDCLTRNVPVTRAGRRRALRGPRARSRWRRPV